MRKVSDYLTQDQIDRFDALGVVFCSEALKELPTEPEEREYQVNLMLEQAEADEAAEQVSDYLSDDQIEEFEALGFPLCVDALKELSDKPQVRTKQLNMMLEQAKQEAAWAADPVDAEPEGGATGWVDPTQTGDLELPEGVDEAEWPEPTPVAFLDCEDISSAENKAQNCYAIKKADGGTLGVLIYDADQSSPWKVILESQGAHIRHFNFTSIIVELGEAVEKAGFKFLTSEPFSLLDAEDVRNNALKLQHKFDNGLLDD